MSSPNADLIAVSLACPKDPKSPYSVHRVWGLLELVESERSWRKLGDLRDIAILVQANIGIFDISRSVLNLVKLSRIITLYFLKGFYSKLLRFFAWIHMFVLFF